jgi:pre-mRNA-splicing factor 38A
MSNRTAPGAKSVHGRDPQLLMEKITRERIYGSRYWKERCFGLSEETVIDRAVELTAVGGSYGAHHRPTDFICLLLKLLQLQPSRPIILAYIDAEEHKYLRVLGAVYWRFTQPARDVYSVIEPLLSDFRRLRVRKADGTFGLVRIDEVMWMLLGEERAWDVVMPRLPKRHFLEDSQELEARISPLAKEDIDAELAIDEQNQQADAEAVLTGGNANSETTLDEEDALRARLGLKPLQR